MTDKEKMAGLFADIAQLLELKGENPFKARAYEAAAHIFEQLDEDPAELARTGRLEEIPGIGKAIAAKATEFINTGRILYHDELRSAIPPVLFEMVKIPGLGAKKASVIQAKLTITSLGELEYACKENRLVELPGFGAKTQEKILSGIESLRRFQGRFLVSDAWPEAKAIVQKIKGIAGVEEVSIAGSLRRRKETVGDVDIVVGAADSEPVMKAVTFLDGVVAVIAQGSTKTSVTLQNGLNVDVRVVEPAQFPCALHHFTGSREHNVILRGLAKDRGMKINEYGVELPGSQWADITDEAGIYRLLGLELIAPELREGGDEFKAALENRLPLLVEESQIKGAFHAHTTWSDGRANLAQMSAASRKLGWEYLGVTDHSRTAFYAGGLKEEAVLAQRREIDEINGTNPGFRIFAGIESDILPDGSLDYPMELLNQFDFVIGSIHSSFGMSQSAMTQRITKAMRNPAMTMLGHPTGRLLLAREGYGVDLAEIIKVAAETLTMIEINASPYRLDLDWRWCRQAKEAGVLLAINPDAHSCEELVNIAYGVGIARKGWLEASDVLNTRTTAEVQNFLFHKRSQHG